MAQEKGTPVQSRVRRMVAELLLRLRSQVVSVGTLERRWNLDSATDLASSVEWAYETAIVGGICENVCKFSTLLSSSCTRVVQCTWDSEETHGV